MAADYIPVLGIVLTTAFTISSALTFFMLTAPEQWTPLSQSSTTLSDGESLDANENPRVKDRVTVLVLGDIGRSPRMQYHALSLAKHGAHVQVVGYHESSVHPDINSNKSISIVPLPSYPSVLQTSNRFLFPVVAPLKVAFQILTLYYALGYVTLPSRLILVQNPPSIPTLPIALAMAFLRRSKLVIDWHNYGFTILATKLGSSHPLTILAEYIEIHVGKLGAMHFTVTDAMRDDLLSRTDGQARAITLHDRPTNIFQPLTDSTREEGLRNLSPTTDFASEIQMGDRRLVVSSTSWTPDEDFGILLDALVIYYRDYRTRAGSGTGPLPSLLVVITGKGPMEESFQKKLQKLISAKDLPSGSTSSPVVIRTRWLTAEDYALLLGCASIGVSLHTSSSGLDLPMKVVDMFGAGLPVVAYSKDFPAWSELVKEGVNGRGFESAQELARCLSELFEARGGLKPLERLRLGARNEGDRRWDAEWDQTAGRVLGMVDQPRT